MRPPPVLVELNNPTQQRKVLTAAKNLANASEKCLRKLYINRDLTPDEQHCLKIKKSECWHLNQKLNDQDSEGRRFDTDKKGIEYYYAIRGGSICTIARTGDKKGKPFTMAK